MTHHDLQRKLNDRPFRPFRIKMVNNSTFDIADPWMIVIGESSAMIFSGPIYDENRGSQVVTDWKTISIAHILEMSNIELKPSQKRKRA